MQDQKTITINEPDPLIRDKLSDLLNKTGWDGRYDIQDMQSDAPATINLHTMPAPIRAGVILDRMDASQSAPQSVNLGPHRLDSRQNMMTTQNGDTIRLTEKETALLQILQAADGASIPREDLLKKVWGYHAEAETHTLETHIYRLRQKIEDDPATPKILMTDESGYFLNLE